MLEYEWGNTPSTIVLTGNEEASGTDSDQSHRQIFDHYASASHSLLPGHLLPQQQQPGPTHTTTATTTADFSHYHFNPQPHHPSFFDPRAFPGASSSYPPPATPHPPMLSLDPLLAVNATHCGPGGLLVVPKSEDVGRPTYFPASRIGLNLGGRTYFSSSEDDFVSRLYRRSRPAEPGSLTMGSNSPRCQAEGCNADLSNAKHYHRRHKVCEFHSKAATVVAAGLTQRFCQQCSRLSLDTTRSDGNAPPGIVPSEPIIGSLAVRGADPEGICVRFHLLSEFDNGKRSCRKRLADHNRRRRKTQQPNQEILKSQLENARNSTFDSVSRSPPDSGAQAMSSVTVAVSPPDYFRQRAYPNQTSSSSATSSSLFFSSG